jgi:hypothetical protein
LNIVYVTVCRRDSHCVRYSELGLGAMYGQ